MVRRSGLITLAAGAVPKRSVTARRALQHALLLLVAASGVGTAGAAHADTFVILKSQPGDYIGGGQQLTLTSDDGQITGSYSTGYASVGINGAEHFLNFTFVAPEGSDLVVGAYEGATRYPFQSPTKPGLDASGDGRGCNQLTGRFAVLEIAHDGSGNLLRFAANFEQHCEGGDPALFGTVRFNSDVPVDAVPPTPIPPTPTPTSYDVYLAYDSEPGDYIGLGMHEFLSPGDGAFTAQHDLGHVAIAFNSDTFWTANFSSGNAGELVPGVYEGATRYPFNGSGPGLDFSGDGRGCNELTGRFVVLEGVYGPGNSVQSFAADFEQHCEGGPAALFGSVRFHSTLPTVTRAPSASPTPTFTDPPTPTGTPSRPPSATRTFSRTPTITLTPTASATNTPCAQRDLGSTVPLSVSGSTAGSPGMNGGSCGGSGAPDQVFSFNAPSAGTYTIDTSGSALDTVVYVRSSCEGFELACNDDASAADHSSRLTVALAAGQEVLIVVDGFGSAAGEFSLHVTRADALPCSDIVLDGTDVLNGSTVDAPNVNSGSCGGAGAGERIVQFTAPDYGKYTFSTSGSALDTVLYLRDAECFGPELACNDDRTPADHSSEVTVPLHAGQRVIAFVDAFGVDAGEFSLHVSRADLPPCPEIDLGSLPFVSRFDSTSDAPVLPGGLCAPPLPTRSFRYTAPSADMYVFSTFGSSTQTVLTVRDGDCSGPELSCDGQFEGAYVVTALDAGQSVTIFVQTAAEIGGKFALQVERFVPTAVQSPTPTFTPRPCPESEVASALPFAASGYVAGSAPSILRGACGGDGPERTFRFTAPTTDTYIFDATGSRYSTVVSILDGDCGGPELGCSSFGPLLLPLSAGQTVVVSVDASYAGLFGDVKYALLVDHFVLTPTATPTTPPTPTATGVPASCPETEIGNLLPVTINGSTVGADDTGRGSCGSNGVPERTFRYEAPESGRYTFDTSGSEYDTVLYLRLGSCVGNELACNDDESALGGTSRVTVALAAGEQVIVFVGGFSESGEFSLHVARASDSCIGDCGGNGSVSISDLVLLVNVALGHADVSACPNGVPPGQAVDISLLVKAVNGATNGCASG